MILISYNEAVNLKILTGSKAFLKQVMNFIQRIIIDPSMKEFICEFLTNYVMKPSVQVIKKIIADKDFLKKEVFDSEIDASMYPLPSFIYDIVKCIVNK